MATPVEKANTNPCGLSAREIEIAVLAWKAVGLDGKVDGQKLAELTRIPHPESAARVWRGIKAKIDKNDGPAAAAATIPATPDDTAAVAAVAAGDPDSPSLLRSIKRQTAPPSAGRCGGGDEASGHKRTLMEADGGGGDHGSSGYGGVKEDDERPRKALKLIITRITGSPSR